MPQLLQRQHALNLWLNQHFAAQIELQLISGDASFRRYFRFHHQQVSYIAVDASPEHENNPLFVAISTTLSRHKINNVEVLAHNFESGFMLLADLGDVHLVDEINQNNYQSLYQQLLPIIQKLQLMDTAELTIASYDETFCQFEMSLFHDWFLHKQHGIVLSERQKIQLNLALSTVSQIFLQQPQVNVHRDLHCKNIMLSNKQIRLIDFQGMMFGPCTYDLASLLKDCYLVWPQDKINEIAQQYRTNYYPHISTETWQLWFDMAGLQRHIKCAGIFCRLKLRDNKPNYMIYLANVLTYIQQVCVKYQHSHPELCILVECIELTEETRA